MKAPIFGEDGRADGGEDTGDDGGDDYNDEVGEGVRGRRGEGVLAGAEAEMDPNADNGTESGRGRETVYIEDRGCSDHITFNSVTQQQDQQLQEQLEVKEGQEGGGESKGKGKQQRHQHVQPGYSQQGEGRAHAVRGNT